MALETENILANTFQQLGQTQETADASTETSNQTSNDFDYDDIDNPLSDLSGFNLNALDNNTIETDQKVSTTQSTTNPFPNTGDPNQKLSLGDLKNLAKKNLEESKTWAKDAGTKFVEQTRNPYMALRDYEFDQYRTKYDRYTGYSKSTFNKLGFDPLDPNIENYYNDNTSNWQDFKRMSGQFANLFGTAFISNYTTFSDWATGNTSLTDPDEELNDAFDRANELGMSSKKGPRAFLNNLALNFAYTAGIMANIAAEELVIAAASTGLAATGAGAPGAIALETAEQVRTANKLRRIYEAWKLGMGSARSVGQVFKGGYQMLKSLKHVNDAREFWTAARAGAAVFGRGALHFVNPFEGTTEAIRGIKAGTMGYRNLTNMAKVSRTFGAFYRDVRNGWFAVGEGKMEGGGSFNDIVRDEIKIYQESNNGQFPPQDELDKIYQRARDGGRLTTLINIPMILLSNKITFDGIFKFRGAGKILNAAEEFGIAGQSGKFVWNLSERTFAENSLGYLKNLGKASLSPRTYIAGAANYFKANLTEGIQENLQDVISGSIKDYYHNTYIDPSLGGTDYMKSVVYDAIGKNVFSKQGLETFASGFLMGGMSSVGGKVLKSGLTGATELFMKTVTPDKYDSYVKNKQQALTVVGNAMNSIMANPEVLYSRTRESLVNQKKATQNMSQAEINKDDKAFHDAKDDLTFDHVFTALDAGTFGQVIGALKSYNKLSDKELADAFNLQDPTKGREKLQEYIGRAEQIKEKYDYFKEKFPNPFEPKSFEKGSEEQIREFIAHKAFEDAKKAAIASQYGFERATERMVNVFEDLQKNPAIKKSSATDYTVLQSKESIVDEIKILKDEISTLNQGGSDEKKLAKKKQKKLDALEDYLENLNIYETEKEKPSTTPDGQLISPSNQKVLTSLSKSFKKYINALAKINGETYVFDDNVKAAFGKITDYYNLSDDAKAYTQIVNRLTNPEELLKYAQIIDTNLMDIYNNRDSYLTESIKNYVNIFEFNGLITALGKMGVIISPDQVEDMVKKGIMPTVFFDLYKNTIIDEKDPRYPEIIEKIETYTKLRREDKGVEEKPTEPEKAPEAAEPTAKPETAPAAQPTPSPTVTPTVSAGEALPADLQVLLKAAYDEYKTNNPQASISFSDYIETSARAAGIKNDYYEKNKGKQQPAPVATKAEAPKVEEGKSKGVQTNPESVGANTDVIVVRDQSERPDIFDEWKDPKIIGAGVQPGLVAKHVQDIYDFGQKLDKEGAPWTIGSFRAEVDDRRMVDVFADGKRFLMYKSTGTGTGPESKGEWTPLFGFAQNGWFIKDKWKGENPKFNKYESETFKAIDKYLKANDEKLFSGPEAAPKTKVEASVTDIKAKKADIKRRRQEELKRMTYDELLDELKGYTNKLISISNERDGIGNSFRIIGTNKNDLIVDYILPDGRHSNFGIPVSDKLIEKYKNAEWSDDDINAKYDAELAALEAKEEEVKPTAPTMQPIANAKIAITGTRRGMENLSTNNWDAKEVIDVRGRFDKFKKDGFVEDTDGKGNKIINYMVNATDAFGRPGFLQLSLIVPKDTYVNNNVLKNLFDYQVSELAKKYGLNKDYINLTKTTNEDFNKIKDAIVNALENIVVKPEVTETQLSEETNLVKPTVEEKTAKEKAKDTIDTVSKLKDLPNAKLSGKGKATLDLIELLSDIDADISPSDVAQMLTIKKQELINNLSTSDFVKGDFVTFTNGTKGFVNKVTKDGVVFKMIDSAPGEFQTINFNALRKTVDMIEEKKKIPVEEVKKVEVDSQDKKEIEASKNTLAEFSSDPAKIKAAMDETKSQTSTSNDNNINNLLKNIGCKTN